MLKKNSKINKDNILFIEARFTTYLFIIIKKNKTNRIKFVCNRKKREKSSMNYEIITRSIIPNPSNSSNF